MAGSKRLVLTLDEVAAELDLSASTPGERRRQVRDLIRAGELRPVTFEVPPHRWRVSVFELRRFLGDPSCVQPGRAS